MSDEVGLLRLVPVVEQLMHLGQDGGDTHEAQNTDLKLWTRTTESTGNIEMPDMENIAEHGYIRFSRYTSTGFIN